MSEIPRIPSRSRALAAFFAFVLGLMLCRWGLDAPSWVWFGAALTTCVFAACVRGSRVMPLLWCALCFLGIAWFQFRIVESPADRLDQRVRPRDDPGGVLITVDLTLLEDPRPILVGEGALESFRHAPARQRFRAELCHVLQDDREVRVRGRVWVRVDAEELSEWRAGDRARLTARFHHVNPPDNPGEEDARLFAAQNGYAGSLLASSPMLLVRDAGPAPTWWERACSVWLRWRADLRARARDVLTRASGADAPDDPRRILLLGLVLGEQDPAHREVRDSFARVGLSHVLSISGFHVALMALFARGLLRLTGDRGGLESAMVAALIVFYLVLIPSSAPILRSAILVLAILLSEALGRRYDALTLLTWIALGLLVWRPLDAWNLGYQLSVGLTAALVWSSRDFADRLWTPSLRGEILTPTRAFLRRTRDVCRQSCAAAILCWLLSVPLVMQYAGLISPYAILATLILTPILIATLWLGYVALAVGMLVPSIADEAAGVIGWVSSVSIDAVGWTDSLPASSVRTPPVSGLWVMTATLLALGWVRSWTWRDTRAVLASGLVLAWLAVSAFWAPRPSRDVAVRIDTFNVGDATCHLIRSREEAWLWDAGSPGQPRGFQHDVVQAVRALGIRQTPTLVLTHPDIDHFGGVEHLVRPLGIKRVLTCERFLDQAQREPDGAAARALRVLEATGVRVETLIAGDELPFGDVRARVLSPAPGETLEHDNDHSLIMLFRRDDQSPGLLLTGDAQDQALALLRRRDEGPCELSHVAIVEAPHHGSARAPAIEFVESLHPRVVIQSSGPSRRADPRWERVRAGVMWLATCEQGSVWGEITHEGTIRTGNHR